MIRAPPRLLDPCDSSARLLGTDGEGLVLNRKAGNASDLGQWPE